MYDEKNPVADFLQNPHSNTYKLSLIYNHEHIHNQLQIQPIPSKLNIGNNQPIPSNLNIGNNQIHTSIIYKLKVENNKQSQQDCSDLPFQGKSKQWGFTQIIRTIPTGYNIIKSEDENIDPILNTCIYFNSNKNEDYDYLSNKMKNIKEHILKCKIPVVYKTLINVKGIITSEIFEEVIDIYENNQEFLINMVEIDDNNKMINTIKEINDLEIWFLQIVEPKPDNCIYNKDWIYRESFKLKNGYSFYCLKKLHMFIKKINKHIEDILIKNHNDVILLCD